MEISVPLPLDANGFLRRKCPACSRQFKWYYGATDQRPDDFNDPSHYHCPLCGEPSEAGQFLTDDQSEFATGYAMLPAMQELEAEMRKSGFDFKIDSVDPPNAITEPDDMVAIAPPCHPWEPVKVPEESKGPYFCLICGEPYSV